MINSVQLLRVDPPSPVVDAFDDVQRARADRERTKNEAETYRNDIVPRARGDAQKLLQDAEAYKEAVLSKAKGEAARFLSVYDAYAESKDVTTRRIYIETMQQILSTTSKVMLDYKGSGNLLYLPLDKLMQQAGAATLSEAQASQRPSPEPVPPAAEATPRSRETLRERGRAER